MAKKCPGPNSRLANFPPYTPDSKSRAVQPNEKNFTGFVFKIQANMDKKHRDRMAFLRVCSGRFVRNQKIFHSRLKRELKISSPVFFQAQDRSIAETAYPGDIIGIHDTGKYQIGDTFTEGEELKFTGIPSFAPEIFKTVVLKDPMKRKQLEKGLQQLSRRGYRSIIYQENYRR